MICPNRRGGPECARACVPAPGPTAASVSGGCRPRAGTGQAPRGSGFPGDRRPTAPSEVSAGPPCPLPRWQGDHRRVPRGTRPPRGQEGRCRAGEPGEDATAWLRSPRAGPASRSREQQDAPCRRSSGTHPSVSRRRGPWAWPVLCPPMSAPASLLPRKFPTSKTRRYRNLPVWCPLFCPDVGGAGRAPPIRDQRHGTGDRTWDDRKGSRCGGSGVECHLRCVELTSGRARRYDPVPTGVLETIQNFEVIDRFPAEGGGTFSKTNGSHLSVAPCRKRS